AQSRIQGLERERQAQAVIIAGLKKEHQDQISQAVEAESAVQEMNELDEERENKETKLQDVLLENKLITQGALEKARDFQKKYGGNLLQFLFVNRQLNENLLVECLCDKFAVPYLPLGTYEISKDIAQLVPIELAEKYWVLPVDRAENDLMLVMVDPFDNTAIKEIEGLTGCSVKVYIGLLSEIAEKIRRLYKVNIRGLNAEGDLVSPLFIKTAYYKGRERRRAVRFKTELALKIVHDNHVAESTTEDICWDGLSFKLDRELPIYSTVTIQISNPESDDGKENRLPIMGLAQVKRVTPLESGNFMIGAKFLKIPQEDIHTIIEHASEKQDNQEPEIQEKADSVSGSLNSQKLQRLANLVITE
ncbi:MAG: hypothetical protein AMJ95_11670, partial [Omnitrophica WOR_2 bacterium SM23_72]